MTRRRLALVTPLALLALAVGCSAPEATGSAQALEPDATVTVVGWSLRDQAPLGITGALASDEADRMVRPIDTRADATRGAAIEHLPPGHYQVRVTQPVGRDGRAADSFDVAPGERLRRVVVVDDTNLQAPAAPVETSH